MKARVSFLSCIYDTYLEFADSLKGLICGAENISNSFAKLAATKLPLHLPNRAWQLERMRRIFDEDTKFFFGTDSNLECAIDVDEEFYVFSQ